MESRLQPVTLLIVHSVYKFHRFEAQVSQTG
jgi:hypothetical protein